MGVNAKKPVRKTSARQDLGSIESIQYNDAAGAKKIVIIDPPIKRTVAGNEIVGAGKYVKVTGTSYTLDLIGRAYSTSSKYQKGDIVTESGNIYLAHSDNITGTFDTTKWQKVAPKQITSIPCDAGAVVTTGRWHNTVTVVGFLVDDESDIVHYRVRD